MAWKAYITWINWITAWFNENNVGNIELFSCLKKVTHFGKLAMTDAAADFVRLRGKIPGTP